MCPIAHCLLVEDEVLIGMDLEEALGVAGFTVRWVSSRRDPDSILHASLPDVAVVDLEARSSDCTDLARSLHRRGVPLVIHTAQPLRDAPAGLDGVAWLEKPVAPVDLVTRVVDLLQAGVP